MENNGKIHELHFELRPRPPYSTDLTPSDFYADLNKMLEEKRFGSKEEVIAETEKHGLYQKSSYFIGYPREFPTGVI